MADVTTETEKPSPKWLQFARENKRSLTQLASATAAQELAPRITKNPWAQIGIRAAGSLDYVYQSFSEAVAEGKEGEYADMMMNGLTGALGTYGAITGDGDATYTASVTNAIFQYSKVIQGGAEKSYKNLRKDIARRIPGLPMLKHEGHDHAAGEPHSHAADDGGPVYGSSEVIDDSGLKLDSAEQARLTEILEHNSQYTLSRIKKGFARWEEICKNPTDEAIAEFEHEYGFLILSKDGKDFEYDFHGDHHNDHSNHDHDHNDHHHKAKSSSAEGTPSQLDKYKLLMGSWEEFRKRMDGSIYERVARAKPTAGLTELSKAQTRRKASLAGLKLATEAEEVLAREIRKGDLIRVKPGQAIPVDGTLTKIEGNETSVKVDTSAYSGDNMEVTTDMAVFQTARSLSKTPPLLIQATRDYRDSTGINMLDGFRDKKSVKKMKDFNQKSLETYLKLMMAAGGLVFFGEAVKKSDKGVYFDAKTLLSKDNIKNTFKFFVAAAPCPWAASMLIYRSLETELKKKGTIVQDRRQLVDARNVDTVILDLAGTLTHGVDVVNDLIPGSKEAPMDDLLAVAARLEKGVDHDTARTILLAASKNKAASSKLDALRSEGELSQKGIEPKVIGHNQGRAGLVEGKKTFVGSLAYFETVHDNHPEIVDAKMLASMQKTHDTYMSKLRGKGSTGDAVMVVQEGEKGQSARWGLLGMTDKPRDKAKATLNALLRDGKEVVIATGSNQRKARDILATLGFEPEGKESGLHQDYKNKSGKTISVFHSLRIPRDQEAEKSTAYDLDTVELKTHVIDYYHRQGKMLMMVGDGFNDAAAMKRVTDPDREKAGVAIGIKSKSGGAVQDAAGIMIDDIDSVWRVTKLSEKLNSQVRTNVGLSAGWMSFLMGLHFFGEKIKKVIGVDIGPLVMGVLHEGATVFMALKTTKKDAPRLVKYSEQLRVEDAMAAATPGAGI